MREHTYFTYILAGAPRGPTYVGVTNDLRRRLEEHLSGKGSEHVAKYNLWRVEWKHELIEKLNPNWENLSLENMDF